MRSVVVAVIDDESLQYLTLKLMVANLGLNVNLLHFADGKEALDYISEYKADAGFLPDCILLDLNMPRITGWEFLESYQIIKDALAKTIPVYVISSSIDESDRKRALDNPHVEEFLVKPLSQSDILSILKCPDVKTH